MKVVGPREVEVVGPEGKPEAEDERADGDNAEGDSDIEPVESEEEEDVEENHGMVVDAHQFPMAGFRFMFLDLIHLMLNHLHYNNHILTQSFSAEQVMEPPGTPPCCSDEVQVPQEPTRSTVRVAGFECERQRPGLAQSLPEVISTFPELEEPIDLEDELDHYLVELAVRTLEVSTKKTTGEMSAAGVPAEEVKEQVSKGEETGLGA